VYELSELSLKFERHLTSEIVNFQVNLHFISRHSKQFCCCWAECHIIQNTYGKIQLKYVVSHKYSWNVQFQSAKVLALHHVSVATH
jgi:hypothetical protein